MLIHITNIWAGLLLVLHVDSADMGTKLQSALKLSWLTYDLEFSQIFSVGLCGFEGDSLSLLHMGLLGSSDIN